jgi:hypothetical protein
MEEDQEDIFKKIIQKAEPEQVNASFTGNIMKMVQDEELVHETALRTLLIKNAIESPSALFERQIISQIIPVEKKVEVPIISKNSWYMIAASILLVVGYSLFAQSPQINSSTSYLEIGNALTGFSQNIGQIPVLYPITLTVLGALLMGDYFILQRLVRN